MKGLAALILLWGSAASATEIDVFVPDIGFFVEGEPDAPRGFLIEALASAFEAEDLDAHFRAVPILRVMREAAASPNGCAAPAPKALVGDGPLSRLHLLARIHINALALKEAGIRADKVQDLRFFRVLTVSGAPVHHLFRVNNTELSTVSDLDRGVRTLMRNRADVLIAPQLAGLIAARRLGRNAETLFIVHEDDLYAACNDAMPESVASRIAVALRDGLYGEATTPAWRRAGILDFQAVGRAQFEAALPEVRE